MSRALALALLFATSCAGELSVDELVAGLEREGIRVAERKGAGSVMQQELDNLNQALATGVPIPKLARRLTLEGISADVFWCPGKAEQADAVIAYTLRGPRPGDPPFLEGAAAVLTGHLNLPVGALVVSLSPTHQQDEAALKVALALAKLGP
ncbi:MAG: hypothetical protein HYS27_09920 [Deltaproteobacteria bacterium]|nr:hypothetical protein [Deltaproteobacteria bacterium]